MKLVDDTTSTYIDVIESNDKDPKFKVGWSLKNINI